MRTTDGRFGRSHGLTKSGEKPPPEYIAWQRMKDRCLNKNCPDYHRYGGRGIKVFSGWVNDPVAFINYVGPRPSPKHSIDRIDNNLGYEPGNVRWATMREQSRNQRSTKLNDWDILFIKHWIGEGFTQKDVAVVFDISQSQVSRINTGSCWGEATGGV